MKSIGWRRKEGLIFEREGAENIELDAKEGNWWKHEVRQDLRWKAWRCDKEAQRRECFEGCFEKRGAAIDYEVTTAILRKRRARNKKGEKEEMREKLHSRLLRAHSRLMRVPLIAWKAGGSHVAGAGAWGAQAALSACSFAAVLKDFASARLASTPPRSCRTVRLTSLSSKHL